MEDKEDKFEKLVLSTKKSLYDPIVIEIDGTDYECVKFTNSIQTWFLEQEKSVAEAREKEDTKAVADITSEFLAKLYKVDRKILDKLDAREIQDIAAFTVRKVTSSTNTGKEKDPEKNESKPGDKV
jgi:hypothetical protein